MDVIYPALKPHLVVALTASHLLTDPTWKAVAFLLRSVVVRTTYKLLKVPITKVFNTGFSLKLKFNYLIKITFYCY